MTCDVCERRTNQFNERETNKYKTIKTMEIYEANQIFVIGIKRFYKGYKNRTKIIFP